MEIIILYLALMVLVVLQTVAGVGILVIGTPVLLIKYSLVDILSILLPLSILTSLLNLFFFKSNKKKIRIKIEKKIKKYFFLICVPAIFFGLILLKKFENLINFNILVSFIILLSIFLKIKKNNLFNIQSNDLKKILVFVIGVIHGLTNAGGTLLSLFITSISKNKKNQSRYNITYYYFFLALFQYLMYLVIFKQSIGIQYSIYFLIMIPFGVLIGNFLSEKISEKLFSYVIYTLAFLSSVFLLINSL